MCNKEIEEYLGFINSNKEILGLEQDRTYLNDLSDDDVENLLLSRLYLAYTAGRLDESKT